jgi:hypothetical protein
MAKKFNDLQYLFVAVGSTPAADSIESDDRYRKLMLKCLKGLKRGRYHINFDS